MQLSDIETAPPGFSPPAFGPADQPSFAPAVASRDSFLSDFFSRLIHLFASLRMHANAHGLPALATLLMQ